MVIDKIDVIWEERVLNAVKLGRFPVEKYVKMIILFVRIALVFRYSVNLNAHYVIKG